MLNSTNPVLDDIVNEGREKMMDGTPEGGNVQVAQLYRRYRRIYPRYRRIYPRYFRYARIYPRYRRIYPRVYRRFL